MIESSRNRERSRGQHNAGVVIEKRCSEQLRDIDRRGLQMSMHCCGSSPSASKITHASTGAALDPEDSVAVGRFEQKCKMRANVRCSFAQAGNLFDILDALKLALEPRKRIERSRIGVPALFEKG